MTNILVNGLKSKVGGGKVIFDTYLRLLLESQPQDRYFVLTPDRNEYVSFESQNVRIIDVPAWAHSNLATLPLYKFLMPRVLHRYNIDAILNFGDIVIPTNVPQVYNFDWAFAVYPDHMIWKNMAPLENALFKVKLHFFEAYLPHATIIMAQTDAMKMRLEARHPRSNVVVVPAAAALGDANAAGAGSFDLPSDRFRLVYPANYYPHKNIDILATVAAELKARNTKASIVLTIDPEEHEGAARFLERLRRRSLDDVIINVGRVPAERIPALYQVCDALLMPTLLETFGLPYAEAMHYGKPILTSDMDFAHAVCGDAALYFDPLDPFSIVAAIERLRSDQGVLASLVERGKQRASAMWSWPRVFKEYQSQISQALATPLPVDGR